MEAKNEFTLGLINMYKNGSDYNFTTKEVKGKTYIVSHNITTGQITVQPVEQVKNVFRTKTAVELSCGLLENIKEKNNEVAQTQGMEL